MVNNVVIIVCVVIADRDWGQGFGQVQLHDWFADCDSVVLVWHWADA